jgi:hypothetical protein
MEIRDYQAGDEKKILELFHLAFKKTLSEDFWHWRFASNPENKFMIKLMWDGDVLAGHYAVSPLGMIVNEEKIMTALSMTTMTHPEYGGRGIFGELAECLYNEEYEKNKLMAIWGFPNSNSHYGFLKNLKWKNLEQIPIFNCNAIRIKETTLQNISVVTEFTQKHKTAYLKATSDYAVKVNKTIEFLHWRFISNPIYKYTIFSTTENQDYDWFAVVKLFPSFVQKGAYEIDIVEFCFPANAALLVELMFAIKNHFSAQNLISINCWMPFDDPKHILLEKIGFIPTAPITYSGVRVMDNKYSELYDPCSWHYSMGDSDVY